MTTKMTDEEMAAPIEKFLERIENEFPKGMTTRQLSYLIYCLFIIYGVDRASALAVASDAVGAYLHHLDEETKAAAAAFKN